jgi:predicted dehydrogenase
MSSISVQSIDFGPWTLDFGPIVGPWTSGISMNFALLGDDRAVLPLVRAIARSQEHHVECAAMVGSLERELLRAAPGLQISPTWDRILVGSEVDAVLVCGHESETLEAAKQVAAAGKALIILPQASQGSTWIYELGLIRDEGHVSLVPVFSERLRPTIRAIHEALDSGALGRLLYLQIDREIVPEGGPALLAKIQVENALLQDVDLLRSLGGDYGRVSAVQSGVVGDRVAAAAATLMGENLPEATWTARSSADKAEWKLVIAGEKGEITVAADSEKGEWIVRTDRVTIPDLEAIAAFDEGEAVLSSLTGDRTAAHAARWMDLIRAFEVVDAARTSARRRRAIDLHLESTSERNIFKSHMTAAGCLMLTFTLVGVVFLLLVMPLFDVRTRTQIDAQRADAIVRATDFVPGTATLNAQGTTHVQNIGSRMGDGRFPVLIAEYKGAGARHLSERRREAVVAALSKDGIKGAAERTQIGPVSGEWYPFALEIVRVLAFLPLGIFLILQIFVVLTRPATK